MDCLELSNVINRGEDTFNQFKANFYSVDKLAVEICAFSNSNGGKLYIGISDSGDMEGLGKGGVSVKPMDFQYMFFKNCAPALC